MISVDEILRRWSAEKDEIAPLLAPWLYEEDEITATSFSSLRRTPIHEWSGIFETPHVMSKFYTTDHCLNWNGILNNNNQMVGEAWLKTQLLKPDLRPDFKLLQETMVNSTGDAFLTELCADLIARTMGLAVRGHSEMKHHEFGNIDAGRIYEFLHVTTPDSDDFAEWSGSNDKLLSQVIDPEVHDPAGKRIKEACAFALSKTDSLDLTLDQSVLVLRHLTVSVSELLIYVAMAHHYLDCINEDEEMADVNKGYDNHSMLQNANLALEEALGPRRNKYPENSVYYDASLLVDMCMKQKLNTLQILLSQPHGIDPNLGNEMDYDRNDSLIWACRRGDLAMIDLLLAAGANVNHESRNGGNAICWASGYGRPFACLRLLRAGSLTTITDVCNQGPSDLVGQFSHVSTLNNCPAADGTNTIVVFRLVGSRRREGTKVKEEGNAAFVSKNYEKATSKYKDALLAFGFECPREKAVVYSNLSQCYLNTQSFLLAKSNAEKALKLDRNNKKARLRLAKAQTLMGSGDANMKE